PRDRAAGTLRTTARRGRCAASSGGRGDRQPLPALGATALENQATVLRPHADEETVGPPATAAIGLIRALHGTPVQTDLAGLWRNPDRSGPPALLSTSPGAPSDLSDPARHSVPVSRGFPGGFVTARGVW